MPIIGVGMPMKKSSRAPIAAPAVIKEVMAIARAMPRETSDLAARSDVIKASVHSSATPRSLVAPPRGSGDANSNERAAQRK